MRMILEKSELKLFNGILDIRANNQNFQLLKTAEECIELSQQLIKVANLTKDRELVRGTGDIEDLPRHRQTLLSEIDYKTIDIIDKVVREYVDVSIELQMLQMQLVKGWFTQSEFNVIARDAYEKKINQIKLNFANLKGDTEDEELF